MHLSERNGSSDNAHAPLETLSRIPFRHLKKKSYPRDSQKPPHTVVLKKEDDTLFQFSEFATKHAHNPPRHEDHQLPQQYMSKRWTRPTPHHFIRNITPNLTPPYPHTLNPTNNPPPNQTVRITPLTPVSHPANTPPASPPARISHQKTPSHPTNPSASCPSPQNCVSTSPATLYIPPAPCALHGASTTLNSEPVGSTASTNSPAYVV